MAGINLPTIMPTGHFLECQKDLLTTPIGFAIYKPVGF
jgi:hypothetical protein